MDDDLIDSHNFSSPFPSASVIKVFLLYYVLSHINEFPKDIETSNLTLPEDSLIRFFVPERIPLIGLLSLLIAVSDNYAANYILENVGINELNLFLKTEGFTMTKFKRHFLDFEARNRGLENVTSVSDIFNLLSKIFKDDGLKQHEKFLFDTLLKQKYDRSKCSLYLPESIISGGKSGVLDNVWNDFIYFYKNGVLVSVCFLTHDLPISLSRDLISSYTYHKIQKYFPDLL